MNEIIEFINADSWNLVWVITALITGGLFFSTLLPTSLNKSMIPANEIAKNVNNYSAILIDIREKNQFVQGHIPGSKNAPSAQLSQYLSNNRIKKEQAIILICENGNKSAQSFRKMKSEGYSKPYVLQMGLNGWRNANYPLTKK